MPTTDRLIEALAHSSHHAAPSLLGRMRECGGSGWNDQFTCRTPGCSACRSRYIGYQRRSAERRFSRLENADLSSASIVIGVVTDLADIGAEWAKFRKDVRNLIDSRRRLNGLWSCVEILLWLEVDAMHGDDYIHLADEKSAQLGSLMPVAVWPSRPVWIVTCHGIIAHPAIDSGQVQREFERRWTAPRAVMLKPFDQTNARAGNIGGVVNYALKHRCRTSLGAYHETWPIAWAADYYSYLHSWSRGFQSTRISVGRMTARPRRNCAHECGNSPREDLQQNDPMPFVHEYSVFPISYNWESRG